MLYFQLIGVVHAQQTPDRRPFITTWKTDAANQTVTIPLVGSGITIHWGDGAGSTGTAGTAGTATHTYANPGTCKVLVYGGLKAVSLDGHPDAAKLVSIDQWGDISWTAMRSAFEGAANMVCKATDVPDLSRVTDTYQMFLGAASFNGDISSRDVSSVTAMSRMFYATSSFNRNLDGWYVQMGDTPVAGTTVPGAVGNVTAQNAFLDGQSPTYDMGAGGDSDRLAIPNGTILVLAETP